MTAKISKDLSRSSIPEAGVTLLELANQFAMQYSVEDLSEITRIRKAKVEMWIEGKASLTPKETDRVEILRGEFPFQSSAADNIPNFRFIDLFAGIGGLRLPFQQTGGECVFSSEWNAEAKKTYYANFSEYPSGDITEIGVESIPRHDLLVAGFPCQPFSQAGLKQGFSDTRGTLFFDIQRIISHHRPPIVLLENVKQLKGHDQGRTLKTITSVLEGNSVDIATNETTISVDATRAQYHVSWRILNAKDYGVPQNRERIFILALRTDLFSLFDAEAVFSRTKTRTKDSEKLGSILQPTSEVDESYTLSDKLWAGHKRRRDEHANKGYGFGYSLFNNDSPYSSTISARYYKDGSEILIDQSHLGKNPRMITPREAARIQGYPENFVISACLDSEIYRQFGNSVALPVVRSLAQEITPLLEQIPQTSGPSK